MAPEAGTGIEAEDLAQRELEALRQSLLPMYIAAELGVVWAWYFYVAYRDVDRWQLDLAALAVILSSTAAFAVRNRHHGSACWLSLLGFIGAEALVATASPSALILASGTLPIVISYALLGALQSLLVGILAWSSQAAAWWLSTGRALPTDLAIGSGLLYVFTWGAVCIGGRPLRNSVTIALRGWSQLRASLAEARERRAELHRTVRALDEATYRIQRMNNQLMVAREAAEAARASKARFAAMVSHELRGPLNLILGFSRLMALSPESYGVELPAAYRADVDAIYQNSRHLVSLLDDILDLSQIEVDRMPLIKDRVDLEEDIVKEVAGIVEPLAKRKGLCLRLELQGDLPPVLADCTRLRQVLLNLLTNAVRYTDQGSITVRTAQTPEGPVVTVADTGSGIADDELPRLFEEFHRLRALEEAGVKGSGLGLAISKHIVELHGGRIWADSTKGVGTSLHFTLPWPAGRSQRPPDARARPLKPAQAVRATCLVFHENPLVVRLLARHIGGYEIVGLSDTTHLVPLVRDLQPRAIIAGESLARTARTELAAASLRVPVLSCELQSADGPRLQGALMYLMKPVSPEMVEVAMRRVERDDETIVMLVDDDRDQVRLLERMLKTLPRPYRIMKAYSGVQALETMRRCTPHVVFMDLLMPEMGGEEVIAAMRQDATLREVPVVVVSARDVEAAPSISGIALHLEPEQAMDLARGARLLRGVLDCLDPALPQAKSDERPPSEG